MKSNNTIVFDSKEIKALIAKALGISIDKVISTHYGFGLQGISEAEAEQLLIKSGVEIN